MQLEAVVLPRYKHRARLSGRFQLHGIVGAEYCQGVVNLYQVSGFSAEASRTAWSIGSPVLSRPAPSPSLSDRSHQSPDSVYTRRGRSEPHLQACRVNFCYPFQVVCPSALSVYHLTKLLKTLPAGRIPSTMARASSMLGAAPPRYTI